MSGIITLTHASLGVPVEIIRAQISFWYVAPPTKVTPPSTLIYMSGGAGIPVKETPEKVRSLMNAVTPTQPSKDSRLRKQ